mgnify:CR=1 FL=1
MSSSIMRTSEDDSSSKLSDSLGMINICTKVPQNQFWSTVAQNLEMLIENGIPECEFEVCACLGNQRLLN